MKTPARGIDVSTWQHPAGLPIDWEAVAKDGVTFVLVKATQGTSYVNPWLARDLDDARMAGLLVGAYHYYELGPDPAAQADHAVNTLMGQVLELGFWLDWEVGEVPQWELGSTYTAFLDKAMLARNPTGTYCDLSTYESLKTANVPVYRLWVADYGETPTVKPFIWQDSETGSVKGVPAPVDTDWLESTRGLNIPTGPPPKPTAETVHSVKDVVEAEATPIEAAAPAGVGEHDDF